MSINMRRGIWTALYVLVVLISCYTYVILDENERIGDALKLARVSISPVAISNIDIALKEGSKPIDVYNSEEYQSVMANLKRLSESFPIPAKWTYIATQSDSQDDVHLPILTIDMDASNPYTLPGLDYNTKDYPAMREAVYGHKEIVVSGIVWDETYNIMTRSGFIKIFMRGQQVGVLCVDLEASQICSNFLNASLMAIIYSSLTMLAFAWIMTGLRLSKGQVELLENMKKEKKE